MNTHATKNTTKSLTITTCANSTKKSFSTPGFYWYNISSINQQHRRSARKDLNVHTIFGKFKTMQYFAKLLIILRLSCQRNKKTNDLVALRLTRWFGCANMQNIILRIQHGVTNLRTFTVFLFSYFADLPFFFKTPVLPLICILL